MILENYKEDYGSYPSSNAGLAVLRQENTDDRYFPTASYMKDSWDTKIHYELHDLAGDLYEYELYSYGSNRQDDHGRGDDIICCR